MYGGIFVAVEHIHLFGKQATSEEYVRKKQTSAAQIIQNKHYRQHFSSLVQRKSNYVFFYLIKNICKHIICIHKSGECRQQNVQTKPLQAELHRLLSCLCQQLICSLLTCFCILFFKFCIFLIS